MSTQVAEERGLVEYVARDNTKIKLSNAIIKRYFVSGRAEYVTDQEMVLYAGICKSRGLNPFTRDVFIVKYTPNEGAAIITSIDYYRKRARAQADCKGWKVGIVILKNGELVYRNGCILLENEQLIGGWAEATPEGWKDPMRKEVNLRRYIKKTKDGSVTRFWSEENQPEMIAKVAESQLLRALWPDEFQGLYVDSEVASREAQDDLNTAVSTASGWAESGSAPPATFEQAFAAERADPQFNDYIEAAAKEANVSVDEVRDAMLGQVDQVRAGFPKWKQRNQQPVPPVKSEPPAPAPGSDTDPNEPDSGAAVAPAAAATTNGNGPSKEDDFRSEWINLKPQGFGKFVERNIDRFKHAAPWVRDEAIAKFRKFYPGYACPIGQTATESASEAAAEVKNGNQASPEAQGAAQEPQAAPQGQSPADVQRQKCIEAIKGHNEAVIMEAKRRMQISIMPSAWPPSLEGCMRLLDMVQSVAEERGKWKQR